MKKMHWIFVISVLCLSTFLSNCAAEEQSSFLLSCKEDNDLYKVLQDNAIACRRFNTPQEAVSTAESGTGVLILADGYPDTTTDINPRLIQEAKKKKLRLYIEYPASLPGVDISGQFDANLERVVVSSDFFGPALERLRIMSINCKRFIRAKADNPHLAGARVAGFDTAVYGLPNETFPVLFEHPDGDVLVATTKLSHFVTGRYAPKDAIVQMWKSILNWVAPNAQLNELRWTATVRASFSSNEKLPRDIELQAVTRAMQWYENSKLLVAKAIEEKIQESMEKAGGNGDGTLPPGKPGDPAGDGSRGIMQCYLSGIAFDGSQKRNIVTRGDNNCEAAMTYALAGQLSGSDRQYKIAQNLLDYYLFKSDARKGPRADPEHGAYGLIAWGANHPAWLIANYGDDNARQMMGIMATAAITKEDRWDEALALCILANIRTTGRTGFRPDRIDIPELAAGWEQHFHSNPIRMAPHFEAYLWSCFLWAYEHTQDELLYERTIRAIRKMMENYPDEWSWTNGLAQEKARMLLPLAWLVRVKDTPEHRRWLRQVGGDLIALQEGCGAIREELGVLSKGMFPPPQSNAAYGGNEASLIQKNGDPVSDLLYTTNFAFIGLHEAAAATGDSFYKEAEDKLAEFLCRIQVRSESHPELDGAWFRGFDFKRWEYWASDADAGWGAWCAITGWTQSWITSVLAMRQMDTSLWELTQDTTFASDYQRLRPIMLPEDKIKFVQTKLSQDADRSLMSIKLITSLDQRYSGSDGPQTIIDGLGGFASHTSNDWLGFEGKDFEAVIDLGQTTSIKSAAVQFLQSIGVGIFLPEQVELSFSSDGALWGAPVKVTHNIPLNKDGAFIETLRADNLNLKGRFMRITARTVGTVPDGHLAAGRKAWLFVGEILVNPNTSK